MNLREKTLSENILFTGNIITVHLDEVQLPNGKTATREVVEHPGGVCVAALNDNDQLLFVRQYRYPYGEVLLELPAGKLSPGEDPLECGKRELQEETGAVAQHYESLGRLYPSPGYCGEIIHMFYASGLTYGEMNPDEDEFLEVERIPLEKAVQMVLDNEITDAKTQTAVLKVAEKRRRNLL
ncbi:MAG: NUDIX hydrolase [Oscillospiraceae bacterium]|nr:NUDIX hydrolase [Oscillospiraceae bacterium]MDD4545963.1 NUDIX hydrolase [Oscillospiraceae bacterium]